MSDRSKYHGHTVALKPYCCSINTFKLIQHLTPGLGLNELNPKVVNPQLTVQFRQVFTHRLLFWRYPPLVGARIHSSHVAWCSALYDPIDLRNKRFRALNGSMSRITSQTNSPHGQSHYCVPPALELAAGRLRVTGLDSSAAVKGFPKKTIHKYWNTPPLACSSTYQGYIEHVMYVFEIFLHFILLLYFIILLLYFSVFFLTFIFIHLIAILQLCLHISLL